MGVVELRRGPAPIVEFARQLGLAVGTVRSDLADELRELRLRIPAYDDRSRSRPVKPGEWSADLYAYDEALVVTANMLGVPIALDPEFFDGQRRLTDPERRLLEVGLAAKGVDLAPDRW
ncbi:MAG: hypothetical protein ABIW46_02275 [Acidimicrobiales bacterium]